MPRLVPLILLLAALATPAAQTVDDRAAPPPGLRRALVVSIDGLRPDARPQAGATTLLALAERGAAAWDADTVLPSVTLPAHASMLTGLDVPAHAVDYNDLRPGCPPLDAPTFVTRAADAGYRTAMVVGKEKLCHLRQRGRVDYTFARAGDRSVADRVLELLDDDYDVIFAHFPNPDTFGHLDGWMSAPYVASVAAADHQVGRILDRIDALGRAGETLVIVTADHGGQDFGHGSDSPEDRHIPWIIAGPGVRPGTTLEDVSVMDTAATVLWALDLPRPASAAVARVDAFGYRRAARAAVPPPVIAWAFPG
jgi:predicted AlkP superfamily pyrophosphatase or phosphodiesterase